MDDVPITRVATADTDLHDIEGTVDEVRMKVERLQWLVTTDGRFVRCAQVVSLWQRGPEDNDLT